MSTLHAGRRGIVFVMVVLAAALPDPAMATVTIPLTVKRMVQVSDVVVEATVARFLPRNGTVEQGPDCPAVELRYTDVAFVVRQVYKGRLSSRLLLVRVLGGRRDDRILRDTYLPFRLGERMMLFVQMNGRDDFPFVGFHQGMLRFRRSGPDGTMPDLDLPDACTACPQMVVDGRNHLLVEISPEGFLSTLPASLHPMFRVVVGPGEDVPAEPDVPSGGVLPPGVPLPEPIASPAEVRREIRSALRALGLRPNPPPLGDPGQPLADEVRPGDPIVRCGVPAQLSDEEEAFEVVPGGEIDPPIEPGASEKGVLQ